MYLVRRESPRNDFTIIIVFIIFENNNHKSSFPSSKPQLSYFHSYWLRNKTFCRRLCASVVRDAEDSLKHQKYSKVYLKSEKLREWSNYLPRMFREYKKKTWNDNTPPLSCCGQIALSNCRNLLIGNFKPDLHNINAHIKFGENPLRFTEVIVLKLKYRCVAGR